MSKRVYAALEAAAAVAAGVFVLSLQHDGTLAAHLVTAAAAVAAGAALVALPVSLRRLQALLALLLVGLLVVGPRLLDLHTELTWVVLLVASAATANQLQVARQRRDGATARTAGD